MRRGVGIAPPPPPITMEGPSRPLPKENVIYECLPELRRSFPTRCTLGKLTAQSGVGAVKSGVGAVNFPFVIQND